MGERSEKSCIGLFSRRPLGLFAKYAARDLVQLYEYRCNQQAIQQRFERAG